MTEISQKEIVGIADLALLALTDQEITMYQRDLTSVLGYFDTLGAVDTDGIEEIGHITGMEDVYRRDVASVVTAEDREALMTNVPSLEGDHISVKNVL